MVQQILTGLETLIVCPNCGKRHVSFRELKKCYRHFAKGRLRSREYRLERYRKYGVYMVNALEKSIGN